MHGWITSIAKTHIITSRSSEVTGADPRGKFSAFLARDRAAILWGEADPIIEIDPGYDVSICHDETRRITLLSNGPLRIVDDRHGIVEIARDGSIRQG